MEKKVGRIENISFPELKIEKIKAKVDTGAYGVALHVDSIKLEDGKLYFTVGNEEFSYNKFKTIIVKNSFGKVQKRFSIFTKLTIGDSIYKFYVSLTDRKKMRYPVLIGRRFLYKFNYLVDVTKKNINDRNKKV
jgi:hypothetical protein